MNKVKEVFVVVEVTSIWYCMICGKSNISKQLIEKNFEVTCHSCGTNHLVIDIIKK